MSRSPPLAAGATSQSARAEYLTGDARAEISEAGSSASLREGKRGRRREAEQPAARRRRSRRSRSRAAASEAAGAPRSAFSAANPDDCVPGVRLRIIVFCPPTCHRLGLGGSPRACFSCFPAVLNNQTACLRKPYRVGVQPEPGCSATSYIHTSLYIVTPTESRTNKGTDGDKRESAMLYSRTALGCPDGA